MDRNPTSDNVPPDNAAVALRKESVDRNMRQAFNHLVFVAVALRKESVDRNISALGSYNIKIQSLSARRAWIEICFMGMI